MFVYVRYGFGYIDTIPARKYNTNVPCPILLSFIKAAYVRDVEEYCRHRIVQLSIDLDSSLKVLQTRGLAIIQSVKEDTLEKSRNERVKSKLKMKPGTLNKAQDSPEVPPNQSETSALESAEDEFELASARARKEEIEGQLAVINTANKYVKDLIAGNAEIDLIDQNGECLNLSLAHEERADSFLTARQSYNVAGICRYRNGQSQVTPLLYTLTKQLAT
uniref:Uncharacterized protein AlNc14C166G7875 n=1 Tax=Albugo laibachii Nc14 TaxID=890382 RepID=F0WN43_9STRA|nr:conserved hypothetical protein [Albugo laibachii Nc14]|eukprot:CCA22731.1 conserved hypothetical protein [Albugo laibachii Nc14]